MSRPPIELVAARVAEVVEGRLASGRADVAFSGVTTDSRRVERGQLFIALRGDRFDGAAFAAASLESGAAGVLVPVGTAVASAHDAVVIEAADTLLALQRLGQFVRRESGTSVVAITDTNCVMCNTSE